MSTDLIRELQWRGLISQVSDEDALSAHLAEAPRTLYCGFDPTADSLHIGSLVPLLALRRFQLCGHRPILLLGGATGLIGDPSFRDDERSLNDPAVVASWVEALRRQVGGFLAFDGDNSARVVNNLDWTAELNVISFLRDIGKHFSVNAMIQRDSVRTRLERTDQGISYTEFSYMLLQGMDYLELARRYQCSLQIGGSDQWGNIVSGLDLVRRHLASNAFCFDIAAGDEVGWHKIWKKPPPGRSGWTPLKTSPYTFYQFWLNVADADVIRFLKLFTFLSAPEIEALEAQMQAHPERRGAQRQLAQEVTALVHGASAVVSAQRISEALFGNEFSALNASDFAQLQQDGLPATGLGQAQGVLNVMVAAGLTKSTGEARKLVSSGAVRINGLQIKDPRYQLDFADALFEKYFLIRRGKKAYHLIWHESE